MPVFIAALVGGLVQAAGTLVGKVLISLGMGYVTYTGLDAGLTWVTAQIASGFGALGSATVQTLSAARVGVAVNIVLSAVAARLLLNGLTNGAVKRLMVR